MRYLFLFTIFNWFYTYYRQCLFQLSSIWPRRFTLVYVRYIPMLQWITIYIIVYIKVELHANIKVHQRTLAVALIFSLVPLSQSECPVFVIYLYFNEPNLTYGLHAPEMLWSRDSEASKWPLRTLLTRIY